MFAIGIEFLTGRVVAAQTSNSKLLEWPIHPGRLFMALVAALHESAVSETQRQQFRAVLQWLEQQRPPNIAGPAPSPREVRTVFVPVNDRAGDPRQRLKQPRHFPSAFVGPQPLVYQWPDVELPDEHREPLQLLLQNLVRVGHSSSLVQGWLMEGDEASGGSELSVGEGTQSWRVAEGAASFDGEVNNLRVATQGTVERLEQSQNEGAILKYAEMLEREALVKGKPRSALKQQRETQFPDGAPRSRERKVTITESYVSKDTSGNHAQTVHRPGVYETSLVALTKIEGRVLGLESTLRVCDVLRKTLLKSLRESQPEWVSGHAADGSPATAPHIAMVPLAFVGEMVDRRPVKNRKQWRGRTSVDGHLLGVGIVIPASVPSEQKRTALTPFLVDDDGEPRDIKLVMGDLGIWTLNLETRNRPPQAVTPDTWSTASRYWASVTPVILDRHPKTDRQKDRTGWEQEVKRTIVRSCEHVNVPVPTAIEISPHAFLEGVPSSRPGRTGFPLLPGGNGKPRRIQTHVLMEFAQPVEGPLLLGSGRFRGYGFCRPVRVRE